jgi:double zinc ribbon protein
MLECASCGSQEPAGSAFCGNCGAPLAALETSTAAATLGVQTCANCGNEEPEGSEFCGNCGAAFSATAVLEPETPQSWPEPEPEPEPARKPEPSRWRSRPVLLAVIGVLLVAAVAAVIVGTGVVGGGSSGMPESAFLRQLNTGAMGPLSQAVQAAAEDAASGSVNSDGARIVQVANGGADYLRVLHGLSGDQQKQVRLLLAFLASNVAYGQALGAFNADDSQSRLALDAAAQAVRSATTRLPAGLDLAADASYVSSQSLPVPPPPPPASTTASAATYVQQVDELLRRSRSVVLSLGAFVPRAARDEISRDQAVSAASSYLRQRQRELAQAQQLNPPPDFSRAQGLLIRALQASVADDEALLAWTQARRDGTGNAQAEFQQANRLGAQATRFKRQFLRVYGSLRRQATGRSTASLPAIF